MTIYSDLNAFKPEESTLLYDIQAVYSSIARILSTRKKSRFFKPEFGSNLERLLFEPLDDITAIDILTEINNSLVQDEPRINIDISRTEITPDYKNNKYEVAIEGDLRGIENSDFRFVGSLSREVL